MTQSLIINSPYEVPLQHWQQARDGSLTLSSERRPAGYEIFDARHNIRRTETLDLVNCIRGRVDTWREAGYPGVTSVTRRLLEHWYDRAALNFWVQGVNAKGGFGVWCWDVAFVPAQLQDILAKHAH